MNILILIVLAVGLVMGFIQGAFKQVANLAGVVVGILLATALYDRFGQSLASATGTDTSVGNIVAFILIAVIVPVALGLVATLLTKFFSAVHLGFVNRLAGAVLGAVCYGLLLSFALNLMDFALSNGGLHAEKLTERDPLFYSCKHASQFAVPDVLIVTDSTEEANGSLPRHGIKSKLPTILGGEETNEESGQEPE